MSENNGGPAFPGSHTGKYGVPVRSDGMTLRDYFATAVDKDEYGDLLYKNLSRSAQEVLAGCAYPEKPNQSRQTPGALVAWQIETAQWEMRSRAALRYMMADAMLADREQEVRA